MGCDWHRAPVAVYDDLLMPTGKTLASSVYKLEAFVMILAVQ